MERLPGGIQTLPELNKSKQLNILLFVMSLVYIWSSNRNPAILPNLESYHEFMNIYDIMSYKRIFQTKIKDLIANQVVIHSFVNFIQFTFFVRLALNMPVTTQRQFFVHNRTHFVSIRDQFEIVTTEPFKSQLWFMSPRDRSNWLAELVSCTAELNDPAKINQLNTAKDDGRMVSGLVGAVNGKTSAQLFYAGPNDDDESDDYCEYAVYWNWRYWQRVYDSNKGAFIIATI